MPTPLENLDRRIADLERAAEDVRAATREAHEATKELRLAEKAVRDLLRTDVPKLVDDAIGAAVKKGLDDYADTIRRAQDEAFDRVGKAFEELASIYVEGTRRDGPSIAELAERRLEAIRSIRQRGPRG